MNNANESGLNRKIYNIHPQNTIDSMPSSETPEVKSSTPHAISSIPSHWTEHTLVLPHVSLRYFRTGGAKPPMILLHGAMDNGLCWTHIAKVLEERYDVLMPDARGHGQSVADDQEWTLPQMVEDVTNLIAHLQLSKPVVIGHSMGAQVATLLGATHPDLVSKILLEDPAYSLKSSFPFTFILISLLFKRMIQKNSQRTLPQIRKICDRLNKKWHEEEKVAWVVAQKEFSVNAGFALFKKLNLKQDWQIIFPKITVPTLLLVSQKGLLKFKDAVRILPAFPDAKITLIENAGHNIRRENTPAFLKAINKFLEE